MGAVLTTPPLTSFHQLPLLSTSEHSPQSSPIPRSAINQLNTLTTHSFPPSQHQPNLDYNGHPTPHRPHNREQRQHGRHGAHNQFPRTPQLAGEGSAAPPGRAGSQGPLYLARYH